MLLNVYHSSEMIVFVIQRLPVAQFSHQNTEIVQMVFLTFFRILKQDIKSSLLPVVLEGLAK